MTKILSLIRGLSGCGKTTFSRELVDSNSGDATMYAADDYFVGKDGVYRFDPSKLGEAHAHCQEMTKRGMTSDESFIIIHNTFTMRWEMEDYLKLAEEHDYKVMVHDLFDGGCTDQELAERNEHGVPLEGIARMRARYEHDWESADPSPPWER
jgi:predicted kinase